MNNNLRKALLQAYDLEMVDLPGAGEPQKYRFSDEFELKMHRLIKATNHRYVSFVGHPIRRAVAAAAIIAVLASGAFSIEAVREPVVKFFTEVFTTFTRLSFPGEPNPGIPETFEFFAPTTPEGFEIDEETKFDDFYKIQYTNANGGWIYYSKATTAGSNMGFDTENTETHEITINGLTGFYYYNKNTYTIFLTDDWYGYTLLGNCEYDILEAMAKEIK